MISSNKCAGSCEALSPKLYVQKETKEINVKVFSMITSENETKAIAEHISCNRKCKFNSRVCNSNQKWNNKIYQCECKSYRTCKKKKIIVEILAHVIVRIAST